MLKPTYSVVAECLARAADARANAQAATDLQTKRTWHTLEASWMRLAESYSFVERLDTFLATTKRVGESDRVPRVKAAYTVAVVDDEPYVRTALARLLRARGFDVRAYASGRDFLSSLPSGWPECLVLDINMTDMTGLELQAELACADAHIPTIMTTAVRSHDARNLTLAAGAIACLFKPVDSDMLLDAIERAIGNR